MTAPSVYSRAYNFRNYQTSNPTNPLPGVQVDIEMNNIKSVTDSLGDCINSVRRSDGSLQNAVVTADSLDESALALIGAGNWTPRGPWATATAYAIGNVVRNTVTLVTTTYVCAVTHISGTFATDYSAGNWVDLTSARSAPQISYDPTVSGLVSTNVKAALDEIDAKVDLVTLPGELRPYAGSAAPSGWLLCYGQAVSRTTYATLFGIVGTTYGVGDASTTFNLPDLRGRAVFGRDDMGTVAANRITNGVAGFVGTTLGAVGGSQSMQAHTHTSALMLTTTTAGTKGATGTFYDAAAATGSTGAGASQNMPPAMIVNWLIKT